MILGLSEYPRNPKILRQEGIKLCLSRDNPGIVSVSQESQDTQTSEVQLCPSQDNSGIVRVSHDSQDTWTSG